MRIARQIFAETGEDARSGFDKNNPRASCIEIAKVTSQRVARELGDGACKFDTGRPCANNDKGQKFCTLCRVRLPLGLLKRGQNTPPDFGGVFQRLEPGCIWLPFVVTEVGMAGPGRQNQDIKSDRLLAVQHHLLRLDVHAGDTPEQRRDILLPADKMTDRPGDFRGGERCGGDLVKQRLKQMMVALVNDRDAHRCVGKTPRCLKPAEAGSDDDDMGTGGINSHLTGHVSPSSPQ